MIVVYDFDTSMAMDDAVTYLQYNEKRFPIRMELLKDLFATIVNLHGRYGVFEEIIKSDLSLRQQFLEQLNQVVSLPAYPCSTDEEVGELLTMVRFLFNINQRQVKQELCDMLMHGEQIDG